MPILVALAFVLTWFLPRWVPFTSQELRVDGGPWVVIEPTRESDGPWTGYLDWLYTWDLTADQQPIPGRVYELRVCNALAPTPCSDPTRLELDGTPGGPWRLRVEP